MVKFCINAFGHSPILLMALLHVGVDTIMLDNEHEIIPPDELKRALQILDGKARAIVRPETSSVEMVDKYWDMGVRSFLMPKVEDIDELARIGERIGELAGDSIDAYSLIPLLESRAALDKVEQVAAIPQVGTINLGPYDLAQEMGVTDYRNDPALLDFLETAVRRIAATGKPAGLYVLPEWRERFRDAPLEHYSIGVHEAVGGYLALLRES